MFPTQPKKTRFVCTQLDGFDIFPLLRRFEVLSLGQVIRENVSPPHKAGYEQKIEMKTQLSGQDWQIEFL